MSTSQANPPNLSIPVCGIGASAGGVEALQQFFGAVADDLGLAYVVIVHLAPDHKSELPSIISRCTKMPVIQVADHQAEKLAPNTIYVIAPDRKLQITDTSVSASEFDQPRGQRTAIDLFFRSLAEAHGDGFAVILSGGGSDGALGAKAVKESGGVVLVQDPSSAAHKGMPRAVIATGVADIVLPIPELAARLAELSRSKDRMLHLVRAASGTQEISEREDKALRQILDLLKKRTGHDFSKYKRATVLRRMSRRLQITHQATIGDYLSRIREDEAEVQALFGDFLISVTRFFRDPDSWAALQQQVIKPLVEKADPDQQIRIWVPGCATGEEAYTLAMLFDEEFDRRTDHHSFVIFASDVDENGLAVARDGLYPEAISVDISEARLAKYFRREDDHYRVVSDIRDRIVFAEHSLLRDPPFSRLDLISCRNLLIYLDHDLQWQVMNVFRYASRDSAYLFLGVSEMADEDSFQTIDKKHNIFQARPVEGRRSLPDTLTTPGTRSVRSGRESRTMSRSNAAESHTSALERVSPPTILVDQRWNVLHLSPSASHFFQQSGGPLARRSTDLVRPELRDELQALLHRAFEVAAPQLSEFVSVAFNGQAHRVAILAQQHRLPENEGINVLVTFLDAGPGIVDVPSTDSEPANELVRELREKLRHTESRLESMRDDHSLTNEDLRAANEELQSLNEEYRSTTEELETSKEELQSMNEELQTVNNELKNKLDEVSRAHSDLENLMAATNVATLFLSEDLRIKRFTPQLGEIFNIKTRDLDRPIADLTHSLDYETLVVDAQRVLASLQSIERQTISRNGRIFLARLSPYRANGGRGVDGVVITFVDMTAIKTAEAALRESEKRLEAELNVTRRLHQMTLEVATSSNMQEALDCILAASIHLQRADYGHIQLLDRSSQVLRIVAHHGFGASYLRHFETSPATDLSASGRAVRSRLPIHVTDINADAAYHKDEDIHAAAGYRSANSTPLINRSNDLVGVLSVFFREPRTDSERCRQLGSLLAQQAADLIESRAQQESMSRLNDALSKRTSELEASEDRLSRQATELLEQDRHRQEFLAALGHELRNPMAAIQSSLSVMSPSDNVSQRALGIMRRQSAHMVRLINDILDITRVTQGRLRIEREVIDLNSSALAAVETVRQQAENKGLKLQCVVSSGPLYVDADPERLAQVFDNLLRNAVAYTDKGAVTLTTSRDGILARASIRDTGTGIETKDMDDIFMPYQRRDPSQKKSGLGLGLTVVKALVEAHGGGVTVHSEGLGRGSEFTLTIPISDTRPTSSAASPVSMPARRQILVVDDQPDIADTLGMLLEQLGQEVRVTYSGVSALAAARANQPDVVFLDLSMPEIDGAELARLLRQNFPANGLTLVAISGKADHAEVRSNHVFDRYLLKPASKEDLAALLNSLPLSK